MENYVIIIVGLIILVHSTCRAIKREEQGCYDNSSFWIGTYFGVGAMAFFIGLMLSFSGLNKSVDDYSRFLLDEPYRTINIVDESPRFFPDEPYRTINIVQEDGSIQYDTIYIR